MTRNDRIRLLGASENLGKFREFRELPLYSLLSTLYSLLSTLYSLLLKLFFKQMVARHSQAGKNKEVNTTITKAPDTAA